MSQTEIFGILNVTSDSFSDGGKYLEPEVALARADLLFRDGASYVDVGAESTRPGATAVSHEVELQRLDPVIIALLKKYPGLISLDSYNPDTIEHYAEISPTFIANDVTGFNNSRMMEVVARFNLRCVLSHFPKKHNQDIQAAHNDPDKISSASQVLDESLSRKAEMIAAGIPEENIILDPGIGFGKTPELNRELIEFASLVPGQDVMIGYSKKSFLGKDRFEIGTNLEAGLLAIKSGARYLRVHDVAGHSIIL
ncbi:MAG: dihydropteroate synthase [Patescibacteria group bacterium]|jgi:dihydropteroate synthase|nr:dihydropteroate synthase [Patescibacteria group bacterium]